jgi:hypothetical protein
MNLSCFAKSCLIWKLEKKGSVELVSILAKSIMFCQVLFDMETGKKRAVLMVSILANFSPRQKPSCISTSLYLSGTILLFAADVSTTKICLDTSILEKSNMGRRGYQILVCLVSSRNICVC